MESGAGRNERCLSLRSRFVNALAMIAEAIRPKKQEVQGKDCLMFGIRLSVFAATWASGLISLALVTGCGQSNAPQTEDTKPADKTAAIRTVPETPLESESSPAVDLNAELETSAGPEEVCQRFLQCLQAGERRAAEKLLTQRALTCTKRAELSLESPGGPQAVFAVEGARYATNKRELATVDCRVTEERYGQQVDSTISWLLRLEPAGWRICGMILDLEQGDSLDFLSFENVADVERIKASLAEDSSVTAVAENNADETIRK